MTTVNNSSEVLQQAELTRRRPTAHETSKEHVSCGLYRSLYCHHEDGEILLGPDVLTCYTGFESYPVNR